MCTDSSTPQVGGGRGFGQAEESQASVSLGAFNLYKLAEFLLQAPGNCVSHQCPRSQRQLWAFKILSLSVNISVCIGEEFRGRRRWDGTGLAVPLTVLGFVFMVIN